MITAEQVADLREGDVVEYHREEWPEGAIVRAPLEKNDFDNTLYVLGGQFGVLNDNGTLYERACTLTVVSRAPRPLYVNHPRTEPCPSDVVRSADPADDDDASTWSYLPLFRYEDRPWVCSTSKGEVVRVGRDELPDRLRLLVDGETGQSVGPDAAEGWAEGFEAAAEWLHANPGPTGIPHDPPSNPYLAGQVVPS